LNSGIPMQSLVDIYNPAAFDELLFEDKAEDLIQQFKTSLPILGEIIFSHGLTDTVGICMLHKHFNMEPSERLLEKIDGHVSTAFPVALEDIPSDAVAYTWKVYGDSETGVWVPLEYVTGCTLAETRLAAVMANKQFLSEMRSALLNMNLHWLLGLGVLHRDAIHNADPNRSIMETTDEQNRILTVQPESTVVNSILENSRVSTTLWRFQLASPVADQGCCHCGHTCRGDIKKPQVETVADQGCCHCKHTCRGDIKKLQVETVADQGCCHCKHTCRGDIKKPQVEMVADQGCCHCKHTCRGDIKKPQVETVADQGCCHCKHTCRGDIKKLQVETVADQGCCHCKHTCRPSFIEAF